MKIEEAILDKVKVGITALLREAEKEMYHLQLKKYDEKKRKKVSKKEDEVKYILRYKAKVKTLIPNNTSLLEIVLNWLEADLGTTNVNYKVTDSKGNILFRNIR